jgi:hypothetical protein
MQIQRISPVTAKQVLLLIVLAVSFVLLPCTSASNIHGQERAPDSTADSITPAAASESLDNSSSAVEDPLGYSNDRVKVKFSIAGVAQANGVTGSWWNLSDTFAPSANYKPDRAWGESWIKPGITTEFLWNDTARLYSGLSYVGSGNIGRDVFSKGIEDSLRSRMVISASA